MLVNGGTSFIERFLRPIDFKPKGLVVQRDIFHIARPVLIMLLMFWVVKLATISILKLHVIEFQTRSTAF
jgi:hypothetical protein